jgi:hypothetical protein
MKPSGTLVEEINLAFLQVFDADAFSVVAQVALQPMERVNQEKSYSFNVTVPALPSTVII